MQVEGDRRCPFNCDFNWAMAALATSGGSYDALLADIGMPEAAGLALIGQVRALAVQAG
jgi:CheY-like chemotaxis protein